ncbi:MAG: hypothetical protein WBD64_08305 [Candidatus Zixiibacteriota bacterium]
MFVNRETEMSRANKLLIALLVVNFATRLLILIRPLLYLDNILIRSFFDYSMISDDSYLCLKIAKNISLGLGPTFDGISFTNGFQPLYVFLMVPIFHLFPTDLVTPVHLSLLILSIFDTLSLFLIFKLGRRAAKSLLAPVILSVFWIFNPYVIGTTLNGMETMIAFFFLLLFLYYYDLKQPHEDGKRSFLLGVILGAAMLARIDSIFLAFSLLLLLTLRLLSKAVSLRRYLRTLLFVSVGALIVYSPWIVYSYVFTKAVFPVSGKAIRLITLSTVDNAPTLVNLYLPMLLKGLKAIWFGNAILIALLGVITLGYLFAARLGKSHIKMMLDRVKRFWLLFLYAIPLFFAYVLHFFAPYYFPRYLFPVILLFLFCLLIMIDLWLETFVRRHYRTALAAPMLVALLIMIVAGGFTRFFLSKEASCCGYRNIGLWAGANLEPGSKVGSCQSGALGYFAENLEVINLDGVVNTPCYEALRRKQAVEYIKVQRIKYVLGWMVNFDFLSKQSTNYKRSDFGLVGTIPLYKTWGQDWYLTMVNYGQLDSLLERKRAE